MVQQVLLIVQAKVIILHVNIRQLAKPQQLQGLVQEGQDEAQEAGQVVTFYPKLFVTDAGLVQAGLFEVVRALGNVTEQFGEESAPD